MKHVIKKHGTVPDLIDKNKAIVHHFDSLHRPHAILTTYSMEHLKKTFEFIIPADTRFGLYLLMIHRVFILKPALKSATKSAEYDSFAKSGAPDAREAAQYVRSLIDDDLFWEENLNFLLFVMPILRLIRLSELDGEVIGKIYPRVQDCLQHFEDQIHLLPEYGQENLDTFREESPKWTTDVHKAAYCLDPEFWDVDHEGIPGLMTSFRACIQKVFHRSIDIDATILKVQEQYRQYNSKLGEYGATYMKKAASFSSFSAFYESYGSSTPELRFMALRIAAIATSNESAEINWHYFKLNKDKTKARMNTKTVRKLITIQSAARLKELKFEGFRQQLDKWTDEDAFIKLGGDIEASARIVPLTFKNWIEDWEIDSISIKNDVNEQKLLRKYQFLYFHDGEASETRRIVDIEWTKGNGGFNRIAAHYSLVTQIINSEDDANLESYVINKGLHEMLKIAPAPFNSSYFFQEKN